MKIKKLLFFVKDTPRNRSKIGYLALVLGVLLTASIIVLNTQKIFRGTHNDTTNKKSTTLSLVDTKYLAKIEQNISPTFGRGSSKFETAEEYYYEANNFGGETSFISRLKEIKIKSQQEDGSRSLTYVAAPGGFGKSWIGIKMCKKYLPKSDLEVISIRKDLIEKILLGEELKAKVSINYEFKADFVYKNFTNGIEKNEVVNKLPHFPSIGEVSKILRLGDTTKSFVIIDGLDEIHPTSAKKILYYLETNGTIWNLKHKHFIIFGRPESFSDYINYTHRKIPELDVKLIERLSSPIFENWNDLQIRVSNLLKYIDQKTSTNYTLGKERHFWTRIKKTITDFPYLGNNFKIGSNARDLVGIIRQEYASGYPQNDPVEKDLRNMLWSLALKRNGNTHGRPNSENDQFYRPYYLMLSTVASHFTNPSELDSLGWFQIEPDLELSVKDGEKEYFFNVAKLLNLSGIIDLRPLGSAGKKYRFEPFWFHRYLVEYYNNTLRGG